MSVSTGNTAVIITFIDYPIVVLSGTCLLSRNMLMDADGSIEIEDGGELLIL